MFLHISDVTYLDEYKLKLTFNNGITKTVDLCDELYGDVFEPLQDKELFKQVAVNIDTNTIEWPNGADFAPEFLYEVETLTERLEIRLPQHTLQMLRQEAQYRGVSMSQLVREAIDLLFTEDRRAKLRAAESLFSINAPVADWEQMKQEIAASHLSGFDVVREINRIDPINFQCDL